MGMDVSGLGLWDECCSICCEGNYGGMVFGLVLILMPLLELLSG